MVDSGIDEKVVDDQSSSTATVFTALDGAGSAFDLFGVQGILQMRRYACAAAETEPSAISQAWVTLGTKMREVMGGLVVEAHDEQR